MSSDDAVDFNVLKTVIARLWRPVGHLGEAMLAMEVLEGPYQGVIFSFGAFEVQNHRFPNGMVPAKFSTVVHQSPTGFVADEAFDLFCSEILLAWLSFIATRTNDISSLIRAETQGVH
jgi:hypothetical protein